MTWFRREPGLEIIKGFGWEPDVVKRAEEMVQDFLGAGR
jgi:hypothetical protein